MSKIGAWTFIGDSILYSETLLSIPYFFSLRTVLCRRLLPELTETELEDSTSVIFAGFSGEIAISGPPKSWLG